VNSENPLEEKTTNVGTPVYMAPELMASDARSAEYNGALADVYAFGILLFAVLSRHKVSGHQV
jgi:serine/threonine protein kinase